MSRALSVLCSVLLLAGVLSGASADPAFTIVVKTDNLGSTPSNQFILPLAPGSTYNFTIDWGDGTTETITSDSSPLHLYATGGTKTIKITENVAGGFPRIYFNGNDYEGRKLLQITNWGDITWASMSRAFDGCANMTITATDSASAKTGAVTDFSRAWFGCSSLTSFPLINTAAGTTFTLAWYGCSGLTSFPLINTAAGIDFYAAWRGCGGLTSFPLINTAAGTNFANAWMECDLLTSFPLINTAAGTNFDGAWSDCVSLTNFPLINTASGTNFFRLGTVAKD